MYVPPPAAGADLRAALVASCLRGALPPVDLRAVCFVRAIVKVVGNDREVFCSGGALLYVPRGNTTY